MIIYNYWLLMKLTEIFFWGAIFPLLRLPVHICAFSTWVVLLFLVRCFLYIMDMIPVSSIYAANFAQCHLNRKYPPHLMEGGRVPSVTFLSCGRQFSANSTTASFSRGWIWGPLLDPAWLLAHRASGRMLGRRTHPHGEETRFPVHPISPLMLSVSNQWGKTQLLCREFLHLY